MTTVFQNNKYKYVCIIIIKVLADWFTVKTATNSNKNLYKLWSEYLCIEQSAQNTAKMLV